MTWSARIVSKFGDEIACDTCKHWDKQTYNGPCQLPKINWAIANLLTAVDKGCDGHMAGGFAKLVCDGYEKNEIASG